MKLDNTVWVNRSCREPSKAKQAACAPLCHALVKVSSVLSQQNPLLNQPGRGTFALQHGQH